MPLVALQPAASAASRKHFEDTINTPVALSDAAQFLSEADFEALAMAHPEGSAMMWGAKPGERGQQIPKWSKLRPGDYIAFAAGGRLFAGAVITTVFRNAELARDLWGDTATANGVAQTWELMFSITDIEALDVPYMVFNPLVGRKENANVQEFAVLGEEGSANLLAFLNRAENSFEKPDFTPERVRYAVAELSETDREVSALRRTEQQAIKKALATRPVEACELCGRLASVEFLTAAHIKSRARCTEAERMRLTAVAMLNCRFGCDELYGKGYVGVDPHGVIRMSELLHDEVARAYAESLLDGRRCIAWDERAETREFFRFHWSSDFRRVFASPS